MELKEQASTSPVETQPGVIGFLKEVYAEFADDDVMTQAAALAFYTGLAMAPLLTVAVWLIQLFAGDKAKGTLIKGFEQVMGPTAAAPIAQLLDPATDAAQKSMTIGAIISLVFLVVSATGVFVQLQAALNLVWDVKQKAGNGVMTFVKARLLSLGMLMSVLFLLMVSLAVSATLQAVVGLTGGGKGVVWELINNIVSVTMFTGLFALLFRYVPDVHLRWKPTWIGAAISAVLFAIGRFGLAYYLGRGDYQTSYGAAAGSLMALLVWVYYSSVILLVGAEVTQVYARRTGERVQADEHAVRTVTKVDEVS